jgi:hypothetical protein
MPANKTMAGTGQDHRPANTAGQVVRAHACDFAYATYVDLSQAWEYTTGACCVSWSVFLLAWWQPQFTSLSPVWKGTTGLVAVAGLR